MNLFVIVFSTPLTILELTIERSLYLLKNYIRDLLFVIYGHLMMYYCNFFVPNYFPTIS